MHINEFEPYQAAVKNHINCQQKIDELETEIGEILSSREMPVIPPIYPDDATPEEIMEMADKNSDEYISKLRKQQKALLKALPGLGLKKREAERAFNKVIAEEFQDRFTEIERQLANAYVAIQAALLSKSKLESEVLASGGDIGQIKRNITLNVEALSADPHNAHQTNFYRDAIASGVLKKSEIPGQLQHEFQVVIRK